MSFISGQQYVARRILVSEGTPFAFPNGWVPLASDIVVSDSTDEPLVEIWMAVPHSPTPDTDHHSSKDPTTIYTNTVVYEDGEDFSVEDIERDVQQSLMDFKEVDNDEWDD